MPVTGIPLPFVTYGGSSLISLLFGLGILQSIRMRACKPEPLGQGRLGRRTGGRAHPPTRTGVSRLARPIGDSPAALAIGRGRLGNEARLGGWRGGR